MVEVINRNVFFNDKLVAHYDEVTKTYFRYGMDRFNKYHGYGVAVEILDYLRPETIVIKALGLWTSLAEMKKRGILVQVSPFEPQLVLEEKYWGGTI